ncbi:unnamed protein product, partial [Amoebophrya sp. A120]|eukprot:GSA120T00005586001.1
MLGQLFLAIFTCDWRAFKPWVYSPEHFWLLLNAGIASMVCGMLLFWALIDIVFWLMTRDQQGLRDFNYPSWLHFTHMPLKLSTERPEEQWPNFHLPLEQTSWYYVARLPWLPVLSLLRYFNVLETFRAVQEHKKPVVPAVLGNDDTVAEHVWFEYVLLLGVAFCLAHSMNTETKLIQRWKNMRGVGRLVVILILTVLEIFVWLCVRNDFGFGIQIGYTRVQATPNNQGYSPSNWIEHMQWRIPDVRMYAKDSTSFFSPELKATIGAGANAVFIPRQQTVVGGPAAGFGGGGGMFNNYVGGGGGHGANNRGGFMQNVHGFGGNNQRQNNAPGRQGAPVPNAWNNNQGGGSSYWANAGGGQRLGGDGNGVGGG